MVELIVFALMAAASLSGAVTVIRARNPVYSAMGLLATLFAMAVLYVLQLAHFVAAVQVIVYAGAVMTLFLFVIMLIGVDKEENTAETIPHQRRLALAVGLIAAGLGIALVARGRFSWVPLVVTPASAAQTNGTVQALAEPMFTDWVLAFEATALLLTIAAAGAIALASTRKPILSRVPPGVPTGATPLSGFAGTPPYGGRNSLAAEEFPPPASAASVGGGVAAGDGGGWAR